MRGDVAGTSSPERTDRNCIPETVWSKCGLFQVVVSSCVVEGEERFPAEASGTAKDARPGCVARTARKTSGREMHKHRATPLGMTPPVWEGGAITDRRGLARDAESGC